MEICKIGYFPFTMGGKVNRPIKTTIEEYTRVDIGKGYYGILVKNPFRKLWHIVQEDCGCLIGTHKNKADLLKQVRDDVATGDEKLMKKQIEDGKKLLERAQTLEPKKFFEMFKER